MATIEREQYGGWRARTGDSQLDKDMAHQLKVEGHELSRAIAQEGCSDALFTRILANRRTDQEQLSLHLPSS